MIYLILCFFCWIQTSVLADQEPTLVSSAAISGANPLHGFKTFSVNTTVRSRVLQKTIDQLIIEEFSKIGKVDKLEISSKNLDLTIENMAIGASAQARLILSMDAISALGDQELPVVEASLFLNTSSLLTKTGVASIVKAWSANTFITGSANPDNSDPLLASARCLLRQFISDFQEANPEDTERPTFYVLIDP